MPDKVFKLRSFIMAGKMRNRNCHGQVQYDEYARKSLVFDPVENILLTFVRFFAECFVMAWTRYWVGSANYAAQYFGADAGTVDAQQIHLVPLVMQKSKSFVLNFSAPRSKICSEVVTQDERRFMEATKRVREGNFRQTLMKLTFLWEVQESSSLIDSTKTLCAVLPYGTSICTIKHLE